MNDRAAFHSNDGRQISDGNSTALRFRICVRPLRVLLPAFALKERGRIFMSTAARHYYRFVYLKSDHWQDLRLRKLVAAKAMCAICNHESVHNDVHHIVYRNLYDAELGDLRVLCRDCHKAVHAVLDENLCIACARGGGLVPLSEVVDSRRKWGRIHKITRQRVHNFRAKHRLLASQVQKDWKTRFRHMRVEWREYGLIFVKEDAPWSKKLYQKWRKCPNAPTWQLIAWAQQFGPLTTIFQNGEH